MNINITHRKRRRIQRDGSIKNQVRWVCSWHDEAGRHQRFYPTRSEAIEYRNQLLTNRASARSANSPTTVGDAVSQWLRSRSVRPVTLIKYEFQAKLLKPLMKMRIDKLTTRDIRSWHDGVAATGIVHSAGRTLSMLKSALAQHAEDTGTRAVAMPTNLQKRAERPRRTHLSIEQVKTVVTSGSLYVAFGFLAGTRISEQLGLMWEDIDFETGIIRIRRTQDKRTGQLNNNTKTNAGQRDIPIGDTLRRTLLEWRTRCPSPAGRVFPAPHGKPILYSNFLHRIWRPTLAALGLPYVSIHSARASFISMLQANGTEIAVAARLAGHKNPAITAAYYSHALNGGEQAIKRLDETLEPQQLSQAAEYTITASNPRNDGASEAQTQRTNSAV